MMTSLPSSPNDASSGALTALRGVLFRCTIRGGHATLAIIPSSNDDDGIDNEADDNNIIMIVVQMGGSQWHNKGSAADTSSVDNEQFASDVAEMRSNIRRMCKLGNELEFIGAFTTNTNTESTSSSTIQNAKDRNKWRKFLVSYDLQSSQNNIKVVTVAKWDASRCQRARCKFFDDTSKQKQQQPPNKKKRRENHDGGSSENNSQEQHSSSKGKQKRMQGEVLADFVLWMLSTIYEKNNDNLDQSDDTNNNEWIRDEIRLKKLPTDQNYLFLDRWRALHPSLTSSSSSSIVRARNELVREKLAKNMSNESKDDDSHIHNNATTKNTSQSFALGGILDAAGGAGHVSLALSLRNIHSTVVDPRPTIGKLPGRDRKILKKSKSNLPFSTYRAWFGSKPMGVDTVYREGRTSLEIFLPESERGEVNPLGVDDEGQQLPICSMSSSDRLLPNCAAIVALHPDEATGVIVQTAVENKIPFVVVPCCVFSRLFPERANPGGRGGVVSTYYELIDWLVDLHPAIRVTTLPFEGANIAVWATFQ